MLRLVYGILILTLLSGLAACNNSGSADTDQQDTAVAAVDTLPAVQPDTVRDGTVVAPENDTLTPIVPEHHADSSTLSSLKEPDLAAVYKAITQAIDKKDYASLNKYIHPKWGVYLIDRPGAIDRVDTAGNIQTVYKKVYLAEKRMQGMGCPLKAMPFPKVVCDQEYHGCRMQSVTDYKRVSDLKSALLKYNMIKSYPTAEKSRDQAFEKLIRRQTVNFDKAIGIDFLLIDGKWYIGVIDFARYTCSA